MATVLPDENNIQEFNYSVNLLQAVLWQYNNAPNLLSLLNLKNEWYNANQNEFWQDWLTNVFDLRTANQFGLVVWGIILGLPLYVNTGADLSQPAFGFGGTNGAVNFNNGNFVPVGGSSYALPIETQRIALQLQYTRLTCAGCVPEINRALVWIFKDYGSCYLIDYNDMTQNYVFNFPVTADLQYLFNNYDILPRPAGVMSTWTDATLTYWGFRTTDFNFNNGIFE